MLSPVSQAYANYKRARAFVTLLQSDLCTRSMLHKILLTLFRGLTGGLSAAGGQTAGLIPGVSFITR